MSRHYGTGSVYQRADGRWVAKLTDPGTGKPRTRYARTETEARKYLAEMTRRAAADSPVADRRVTLRKYADEWLEGRAGRRRSESTLYEYRSRLDKHILPSLGSMKLAELTIPRVEAWFEELLDKGLAPSTVRAQRNTLAAILSDAVKHGALTTNVARRAELPYRAEAPSAKIVPPTVTDTRKLLDKADTHDPEIGRFLRVIASTGARIGEVAAMNFEDVTGNVWRVNRTITRDKDGRSRVGDTTKTRKAREVRLSPEAVEAISEQKRAIRKRQLAAVVWHDESWMWATTIGTAPDLHNLRKRIRAVAKAAGFPGSAKSLRHLFASIAAESVELTVVAKLLGHARASTTSDTYAHLRPETGDEVVERVASKLRSV